MSTLKAIGRIDFGRVFGTVPDRTPDDDSSGNFTEYLDEKVEQLADAIRTGLRPALRDDFIADLCDMDEDKLIRMLLDGDTSIAHNWLLERAQRDHNREVRDEAA